MKKIFSLIFLLAVSYSCASAQIKKGSIYIDGTVNYNKGDLKFGNNNFSTNSGVVTISPGVGYFLTNNLVIGLGLDFQSYNSSSSFTRTDSIINADKSVSSSRSANTTTSVKWSQMLPSIFVKYFMPVSSKLGFYINARYSTGSLKDKSVITQNISTDTLGVKTTSTNSIVSEKPSIKSSNLNISAGMHYLVTDKFGLEVNFGGFNYSSTPVIHTYNEITFSPELVWGTQKATNFNINPRAWSLGVFILLGGKK